MGNHLKFMLHTTENPSWKATGLKGSKIHPVFLFVIGRERRGRVGTGKLSLIFPPGNGFCSWLKGAAFRASLQR